MGTFLKYIFYLAVLAVLVYIGVIFYYYNETTQPPENETIVISKN